ncbi:MAG: hypothetical protein AAFY54_18770, partial [Cyanobacteria bacterium J06648_10]
EDSVSGQTYSESANAPSETSDSNPLETEERPFGVTAVEAITDTSNSYTFSVEVSSPDEGCDNYANWWEVITEDGRLLYRRILAHSHVDEQPFTRSGGPVEIEPDEVVIVRSHMHPTGYHTQAMKGSFSAGFEPTTLPTDFADELAEVEPLPTGCAF